MSPTVKLTNPIMSPPIYNGHLRVMMADIEYRKDNIHIPERGRVSVQIYEGFVYQAGGEEKVKSLLCYYAVEKLKEIFIAPNPTLEHAFEPSESEYKELRKIDLSKIHPFELIEIDKSLRTETKKIFISCGQANPNEKILGRQIKDLIDSKGHSAYFAENQQSLDGLTKNIFQELNKSQALIAVMHRRDLLKSDEFRGSVWIEQEIAIAAFRQQIFGKDFL